jgi:1,2-phenylacetyl-CoA epoxidase catalytic subunit
MTETATRSDAQFEAGQPLPDEYRQLLYKVLKVAADTETSLLFPETDWLKGIIDLAPTPADRIRITRLYWEELNHGWFFYKIWEELGVTPTADDYRGTREVYFAATPLSTWTDVGLMNCLTDRAGLYQYRNMAGCSYLPLARVVPKIEKDEIGHAGLGYQVLKGMCETASGKAEVQRLLAKWYPVALDMFGRSDSRREDAYIRWGLKKHRNEELRQAYIREVRPLLEGLGLDVPDEKLNRKFL